MEKIMKNCITGEIRTIHDNDGEETPKVAMFIKCNRMLIREAQEQKYHRVYEQMNSGIIEIDHDIKIVFVDMETGKIISEI